MLRSGRVSHGPWGVTLVRSVSRPPFVSSSTIIITSSLRSRQPLESPQLWWGGRRLAISLATRSRSAARGRQGFGAKERKGATRPSSPPSSRRAQPREQASVKKSGSRPSLTPRPGAAAAGAEDRRQRRGSQSREGATKNTNEAARDGASPKEEAEPREVNRMRLSALMPELQQTFDDMKFPSGFTDIQLYGIPEVLKRKDAILASQTGTGKTLAYLLPLFQMLHEDEKAGLQTVAQRPPALILLPNRELSKQVLSVVKHLAGYVKLRSAGITSGTKLKIQKAALDSPLDILVSTPGRLLQHFEREKLFFSKVRYLVIDEGDTLFDETFKDDIEKMLKVVRSGVEQGRKPPQTILVTATVTSDLANAIDTHFPKARLIATSGLHRTLPSIKHEFVSTPYNKHESLLKAMLGGKTRGKTIIFCNDMQSARSTHHFLTDQGFNASCLHSGILPKRRAEYFEQFKSEKCTILVCTDIASRGLDTISVDHVILFDFPTTATGYLHRVGRTGRAGRRGRVTCLLQKGEQVFREALDLASKKQISLSDVLPYFSEGNHEKRKQLAAWLNPLALLPDHNNKGAQQRK